MSNNNIQLGIEAVNYENQGRSVQKQVYKQGKKKWGRTYINILHDPRVVRGNTYAAFVIPSSLQMEFIRLKEEEQRRKRLMSIPKKVPRVANLGKKKTAEDSYFENNEEEQRPESPLLKRLDDPDFIEDKPYFFEDRPPTPVYVPKPPGVEIATQIEDGELFDFDLEVEPILEVLIGGSLIQAKYELIEDHEREFYLNHKKEYEQKREFELINLQRMEALRIRKEQEKDRRNNQTIQKKLHDTLSQKKLISKVFAKTKLKSFDKKIIKQLNELGFLKERLDLKLSAFLQKDIIPVTNKLIFTNNELNNLVTENMKVLKKQDLANIHNGHVAKENERIRKIKEEYEMQKQNEIENEKNRIRQKAERKENRRVNRITNNILENVISTKEYKPEVNSISLADIDDFSTYSERIHVIGGLFGLVTIILDELMGIYNLNQSTSTTIELISTILEEFIFKCLKENQNFEIKYLESERFNFKEINEDRRPEFIDFIHDYRRFVNKSLKLLIDKKHLSKDSLDLILSAVVAIYFKDKSSIPPVEVNSENQDPEYLEKVKHEQDNYADSVARLEAIKKKIKFVMIKPNILKKRRENMAAFVQVYPNLLVKDTITDQDDLLIGERPKTTINKVSDEVEVNNPNVNHEEVVADPNNNEAEKDEGDNENENGEQEEKKEGENQENIPRNNEGNLNKDENKEKVEENKENENATNQPKIYKLEYLNEAQIFKNSKMKYEPYILHNKLHEFTLINLTKSFRKIVKNNLKLDTDLNELIRISQEKYDKFSNLVLQTIMNNEIYIKDKIVPIDAMPLETKPDEPVINQPVEEKELQQDINPENHE